MFPHEVWVADELDMGEPTERRIHIHGDIIDEPL